MQKTTKLLGTVCVLAVASMASPAAAASLTDWTGVVVANYEHNNGNNSTTVNTAGLGGSAVGPLGVPNLNVEVDGRYMHHWGNFCDRSSCSAEEWLFGGSGFWGGMDGRIGINGQYNTVTHGGHVTNGGVFGEYYFGNFTADLKAGWLSTGGTAVGGGHGNYIGGDATFYALPDLAVTAGVHYADRITGICFGGCTRIDINNTTFGGMVEYLLPFFPVSIGAGIAYTELGGNSGHVTSFGFRLVYYPGAPSLIDAHRNGALHSTLTGVGLSNSDIGLF